MNHLLKRPLSLIMAILMVLSLIPATPVHVHADGETSVTEVTIGKGLSVLTGQENNPTFQAYPVSNGAMFAVKLDNKDAFCDDKFDGIVTVEVEYLLEKASTSNITIKENFQFAYGSKESSSVKVATPTYFKPGNTAKSKIAVYELSKVTLTGNYKGTQNIAVGILNQTGAYVGICSIKITKGIDTTAPELDTTYNSVYCAAYPDTPTIINKGASKQIFAYITIKKNGDIVSGYDRYQVQKGTKTVLTGKTLALVEQSVFNNVLKEIGPGDYQLILEIYWNVVDASHKVVYDNITYQLNKAHNYTEEVDGTRKPATCVAPGSVTKKCACGDQIVETLPIDPNNHQEVAEAVKENNVAATCTTDGSYDNVVYCSDCNKELSRKTVTVTAPGHTPAEAVKENEIPASCGTDGSYEEVVYCSACDKELSRKPQTVTATGEHVYATETDRKDATCTEDGYVIMACGCGEKNTEVLPKTGHTNAEAVKEKDVAATCTTAGSYDNVVYCSVCNGEISRNTVTVDALGHNYEKDKWEKDDTHHWKPCTNDGCDEKESNEAHSLGQYQADNQGHWKECDICDFTTTKGAHTLKPAWNNQQHWQYCTECDKKGAYGNHKDTNPWEKVDDETHSRICTGCPYTQTAPHDNDKAECVCGHKAAARIGETYYPTLTKALAAAKNGATVTLLADQTADVLSIDPGVTLNLNGKTVKARQVTSFGDIIDSSEDNTGRLNIEDRKNSLIQKGNDQLPVKTETGYAFVEVTGFNQKVKDAESKYIFQPLFEEDAHDLLLAEDTGVSIIVRVSWNYNGEPDHRDFVFSDEMVKAYIASYGKKTEGEYGKQFALRLIGTDAITNLTFTAVVRSAGVEITSQVMSCPSNAEEAPSN